MIFFGIKNNLTNWIKLIEWYRTNTTEGDTLATFLCWIIRPVVILKWCTYSSPNGLSCIPIAYNLVEPVVQVNDFLYKMLCNSWHWSLYKQQWNIYFIELSYFNTFLYIMWRIGKIITQKPLKIWRNRSIILKYRKTGSSWIW